MKIRVDEIAAERRRVPVLILLRIERALANVLFRDKSMANRENTVLKNCETEAGFSSVTGNFVQRCTVPKKKFSVHRLILVIFLLRSELVLTQTSPDEFALIKFKNKVTYDPLGALDNWQSDGDICTWTYVKCDSNGRVISLNLQNNVFTGFIPTELGNMTTLQELRLGGNPLQGFIPSGLGNNVNMYYLNIASTNLTGSLPPDLGQLQNLTYMFFDSNLLSGPIPEEFWQLDRLRVLNVSDNRLDGPVPHQIFNLPELATLDISNNNLSGLVPALVHFNFRFDNNPSLSSCEAFSDRILLSVPLGTTEKQNPFKRALVFGILGAVTVFLLLCVSVYWLWRCCKQSREAKSAASSAQKRSFPSSTRQKLTAISEKSRKSIRCFTLGEMKVAIDNFNPDKLIGQGGFGVVYRTTLPSGEEVAIKRAHKDAQQGIEEFYNEVELLSTIRHEHLVKLIGFCEEGGEQMLVYEFVPNGNLFEHLSGKREPPLTWKQRVKIALCCAKGLEYLHDSCDPPIIHRDIKPSNILLDENLLAKVTDFGLSKAAPTGKATHISTGIKGTPGYLDPYYYLSWHVGTFTDVYSFGVILLQLVTAKPAVDRSRKNANYNIVAWAKECVRLGRFEEVVDPALIQDGYNQETLTLMVRLALRCCGEEITERPTMSQISDCLEQALQRMGSSSFVKGAFSVDQPEMFKFSGQLAEEESNGYQINFDGKSWIDIKHVLNEEFGNMSRGSDDYRGMNQHLDAFVKVPLDAEEGSSKVLFNSTDTTYTKVRMLRTESNYRG
ncbi:hypothetical protein R1flu_010175 [Riccia fluitans]|uniref:non-specific serine/threonine protein kinase n=1 Tax=Riccia fluitans TaxID=41844 RepID=A0ABD1Z547_9MARC